MTNKISNEETEKAKEFFVQLATKILKAKTEMERKIDALDKLLPDAFTEYFGESLDELQDVILDLCGVPEEETPFEDLKIDTSGMYESQEEYGFCRDYLDDKLWELSSIDPDKVDYRATILSLMDGTL